MTPRFSGLLAVAFVACVHPAWAADTPIFQTVTDAPDGTPANGFHSKPALSGNGRCVVFESTASNLVAGDTNDVADIFVFDSATRTTTRESVGGGGAQANGASSQPVISDDCRFVVFESAATNLAAGANTKQIYLRDRSAGSTTLVSVSSTGAPANAEATYPAISGDGRVVSFTSTASNLVAGDTNGYDDIFTRDMVTGITSRESVSSSGAQATAASYTSSLSADGWYVAFSSTAGNLVSGMPGPADGAVFVRDRTTGQTTLVSTSAGLPIISGDGRSVLFIGKGAPTALGGNFTAILVRDRLSGETSIIETLGGPIVVLGLPRLSADGRFVSYARRAPSTPYYRISIVDRMWRSWNPQASVCPQTACAESAVTAVAGNRIAFRSLGTAILLADLTQASPPGAPQNPGFTLDGSQLALSWSPPVTGAKVSSYQVYVDSDSTLYTAHYLQVIDTKTDATHLALPVPAGGRYYIRIAGLNDFGPGLPSNQIVVETGQVPPAVPAGIGAPGALAASVSGLTVTLTWKAATGGRVPTDYRIVAGTTAGESDLGTISTGGAATSFTAPGVPAGMYYARIRAVSDGVVSSDSNEVSFIVLSTPACTSPPAAPTGLSGSVSGSTVSLSWTAPDSPVSSYVLEAGSGPGFANLANFSTGGVATTFSASDVAAGRYFVRVRARNDCGAGPASNEVAIAVSAR